MRVGALQRLVRAALGAQLLARHRRHERACGLGEPCLEQPLRALGALQLRRRLDGGLARLLVALGALGAQPLELRVLRAHLGFGFGLGLGVGLEVRG